MYIVDLGPFEWSSSGRNAAVEKSSAILEGIYTEMDEKEVVWVFSPTNAGDSGYYPMGMEVAEKIRENSGYYLKNIITRYANPEPSSELGNSYENILLLVKDLREYEFNKDSIRVEHIYKGNEWKPRREGTSAYHNQTVRRYNPDGKDPGNVWLSEIRTQTDDQTVDEIKPLPRIEAMRRCILASTTDRRELHLLSPLKQEDYKMIDEIERLSDNLGIKFDYKPFDQFHCRN